MPFPTRWANPPHQWEHDQGKVHGWRYSRLPRPHVSGDKFAVHSSFTVSTHVEHPSQRIKSTGPAKQRMAVHRFQRIRWVWDTISVLVLWFSGSPLTFDVSNLRLSQNIGTLIVIIQSPPMREWSSKFMRSRTIIKSNDLVPALYESSHGY